jgi:hypothetical protein
MPESAWEELNSLKGVFDDALGSRDFSAAVRKYFLNSRIVKRYADAAGVTSKTLLQWATTDPDKLYYRLVDNVGPNFLELLHGEAKKAYKKAWAATSKAAQQKAYRAVAGAASAKTRVRRVEPPGVPRETALATRDAARKVAARGDELLHSGWKYKIGEFAKAHKGTLGMVGLAILLQNILGYANQLRGVSQQKELGMAAAEAEAAGMPSYEDQLAQVMLQKEMTRTNQAQQGFGQLLSGLVGQISPEAFERAGVDFRTDID